MKCPGAAGTGASIVPTVARARRGTKRAASGPERSMRTSTSLSTPSLSDARAGVMAIVVVGDGEAAGSFARSPAGRAGPIVPDVPVVQSLAPAVGVAASALIPGAGHDRSRRTRRARLAGTSELLRDRQYQAKHRHDR